MKFTVERQPLVQTARSAAASRVDADGVLFLDFGKAAFGTLTIKLPAGCPEGVLVVHLGEKLGDDGRIDRSPPGTIRYICLEQRVEAGASVCRLSIPPDARNTGPAAIKMPDTVGEVYPFRYAELEAPGAIGAEDVRQVWVHYPFDDEAATFDSSDSVLNAVWALCKYSIKATTFCGVYVDGDRERIPYEGDAYINQLGHYGVDHEYAFARYSNEYMIQRPTWCTEWHLHSVLMAWADYLYTGDISSVAAFYDDLCAKTLIDFARADGLISVAQAARTPEIAARLAPHFERGIIKREIRDVIDWPPGSFTDGGTGERDNFECVSFNIVVNAFHCRALTLMSRLAAALGRKSDRAHFAARAGQVCDRLNALMFDESRGVYCDGEGSTHASLHGNMFMLAFGLVPSERAERVLAFVKSRGMACSVYGAQHLLDALYRHGEAQYALELMRATHDRSWWHMLQVGSTLTLEAWDLKYKRNLDWNHAWGAAPANIVGRYVLGVRPMAPGFRKVLIQPQPADLPRVAGRVPTPLGAVTVSGVRDVDGNMTFSCELPAGTVARVELPWHGEADVTVALDDASVDFDVANGRIIVDDLSEGLHTLTCRRSC